MRRSPSGQIRTRFVLFAAACIATAGAIAGCEDRGGQEAGPPPVPSPPSATPSTPAPSPPPAPPAPPEVRYAKRPIAGQASLTALHRELGDRGMRLVFEINRRDLAHVRSGDTLTVPETIPSEDVGFLDYSPLPHLLVADPGDAGVAPAIGPKLVLVSLASQAFGAYENGRLVRWGAVSTGRHARPTPPRLYHVNWKARTHVSTVDSTWTLPWVLNLDSHEGISMHQYALPGYPASHSCIRLHSWDAEWLYGWVDQWTLTPDLGRVDRPGTPVLVFGEWRYGQRGPWRRLPADPHATTISGDVVRAALLQYLGSETREPPPVAAAGDMEARTAETP